MTAQPQPAPPSEERPLWKLNRDEQRMMMITVVGGLVSILLGAVIIGIAIGFARASYHNKVLHSALHSEAAAAVMLPLAVVLGVFAAWEPNPSRKVWIRIRRRMGPVIIGLWVLAILITLLIWTGQAAGIK